MEKQKHPKILIVTAAFGDGHNSAARNLEAVLRMRGVEVKVTDPCQEAYPRLTPLINRMYRYVTTEVPKLWEWIYRVSAEYDYQGSQSRVIGKIQDKMVEAAVAYEADVVISTYPLYPYFARELGRVMGRKVPIYTVVTDSIEINAAWTGSDSERWYVTDRETVESLEARGILRDRVVESGFPVSPKYEQMAGDERLGEDDGFKVLYLPTSREVQLANDTRAILEASKEVRLTMVLGRNTRKLYRAAKEVKEEYGKRVKIIGWTKRMPELMHEHHLLVGKAGGATVHEAIAACLPILIHHLVPGQEEGNLKLLEKIGGGGKALRSCVLQRKVAGMLEDGWAGWKAMKRGLKEHGKHSGAQQVIESVLELEQGKEGRR